MINFDTAKRTNYYFNTVKDLIKYVNSKFKTSDFDCACFAYYVRKYFKNVKTYIFIKTNNWHVIVEVDGRIYHKYANNPAEEDLNPRDSNFIPITYISSDEELEVIKNSNKYYLNSRFLENKIKRIEMDNKELLHNIKDQLFDAPSEVKKAFNTVVGYFDKSFNPEKWYVITAGCKVVLKSFNTKEEADKWASERGTGKLILKGSEAISRGFKYKTPSGYQG